MKRKSKLTKEQFFDEISRPRNATLIRIFLSMGLNEHTGQGTPTITNKCQKEKKDKIIK